MKDDVPRQKQKNTATHHDMRQGWFESRGLRGMAGRCRLPSSGSCRTGRHRRLAGRRGVVGAGGGGDVAGAVGGDVAGAVGGDVAGTSGGDVAGTVGGGVGTSSRSAADLGGCRGGGSPPAECSIPSSCPPDLLTIRKQLK
jgi:hypothetical protein